MLFRRLIFIAFVVVCVIATLSEAAKKKRKPTRKPTPVPTFSKLKCNTDCSIPCAVPDDGDARIGDETGCIRRGCASPGTCSLAKDGKTTVCSCKYPAQPQACATIGSLNACRAASMWCAWISYIKPLPDQCVEQVNCALNTQPSLCRVRCKWFRGTCVSA